MPDDVAYLLQNLQDPGGLFFPWREFDKRLYNKMIERVLQRHSV